MTIYIIWKSSDDEQFRAVYEQLTSEEIQLDPFVSPAGTEFCVGTSRVDDDALTELRNRFEIVTLTQAPKNWTLYVPE